jgi:hypothetical protein
MSLQELKKFEKSLNQAREDLDLHEKAAKPYKDVIVEAKIEYQKAFLSLLMSKEVLSEPIWNLRIGTPKNGKKAIELRMPDSKNQFFELVKQYTKIHGPLFLDFQTFTINEEPKIYLTYSGFTFSSLVPMDEQIKFLKENEIRFDTSLGWEKPKGYKRILKQLDNLYS